MADLGGFAAAVTTLLDAFGSGVSIIRRIRHQRTATRAKISSEAKTEELRLRKCLKKNRKDVYNEYTQKLARLGRKFSHGDDQAQLSLNAILFRLNAGFVSIIDRFTRGESNCADYRTLAKLSNASRIDAIKAFDHLSARISSPSLHLTVRKSKRKAPKASKKSVKRKNNAPSKAQSIFPRESRRNVPLEQGRKVSLPKAPYARTVIQAEEKRITQKPQTDQKLPLVILEAHAALLSEEADHKPTPPDRHRQRPNSPVLSFDVFHNRFSLMSFASDSTKLGEILPHRRDAPFNCNALDSSDDTLFPLTPWKKPEKQRSRLMRLFGK